MKKYEFDLQFYLSDGLGFPENTMFEGKPLMNSLDEFAEENSREGFSITSTGLSQSSATFSFEIMAETLEEAIILASVKNYSHFPFRKDVDNSARAVIWIADLP